MVLKVISYKNECWEPGTPKKEKPIHVIFDDVELVLDADEGWRFPTDEEYKKQQSG